MTKIHISNGLIVDPANNINQIGSVYVADGKIIASNKAKTNFTADIEIDAEKKIVCPGFVDLSARMREPGQTYKGTIQSETAAAARSGVTSLCLPPDTNPVIDTQAVVELIAEIAEKSAYTGIYPIAALTQKLAGLELSSMATLKQAGCIAVSNANAPVNSLLVLRRAMEYASSHDLLLLYNPDEPSLANNGCVHEGAISTRYGIPGRPAAAESVAVAQCLELAELTGCRVHFSQISCKGSAIKIQQAKKYGLMVTADAAIHQLHLTENEIEPFNSAYHVRPPFRTETDKQHLRESLANGTLDALCSDHQPHNIDAKLGAFPETKAGISSLETLLPLTLQLVKEKTISLSQGIAVLTQKPADIIGIKKGRLTTGYTADICIFDPSVDWRVDQENWYSAGHNTPFWDNILTGRVTQTIQSGNILFTLDNSIF